MKSIRLTLLLALLATVTLVNFVSLLRGYSASIEQAEALFDQRLKDLAGLIDEASLHTYQNVTQASDFNPEVSDFFQIWDEDKATLLHYSTLAPKTLLSPLKKGFHDINYDRYRWRVYIAYYPASSRWIVTGERYDLRFALAEQVAMESVYPTVIALPIMAFIIWGAIGLGLKPLKKLAEQLKDKRADDLSPVIVDSMPQEISQLVLTINDLLFRLGNAFQREQRFSSDAAHELRTPVSILKVHLYNLKKAQIMDNAELMAMEEGLNRLGHSVEQILALYRTSPDTAAMQYQRLDLYVMTQEIIAESYNQFEEKQQKIALSGHTAEMYGNIFAITTLIQNLLSNANKYTPCHGQILVDVRQIDGGVRWCIEDSGVGIPETEYQRVFERFYRLHGDRHHSGESGSGLGLAIVKHIVTLHDGRIMLSPSQFSTGLKVIIDFPLGNEYEKP